MWVCIYKIMTSRAFGIALLCLASLLVGAVGFSVLKEPEAMSQETVKGFPQVTSGLKEEARKAEEAGRSAEAVLAYEKLILVQPDVPEGYFRLGALYFKMGLLTKAEETYLKAVRLNLDAPEAYFRLGYVAENQGDMQKAFEYYQRAEENLSSNPALFFNLGNVAAALDRKDQALEYYKRAVAQNPSYMDAFVNLSVVSFHKGAYADAEFYLGKAMDLGYKPPRRYLETLREKVR